MTFLIDSATQTEFDIPTDLAIPIDRFLGELGMDGTYSGGGSIEFDIERSAKNERLIEPYLTGIIPVVLLQGRIAMAGNLRVLSYTLDSYTCRVDDQVSSLFEKLNDTPLRMLDLSEFDHTWDFENVIADRSEGWIYCLEERGTFAQRPFTFDSWTLANRFAPMGSDADIYNFYPGIFIHTLLSKCIQFAGFDIQSPLIQNSGSWFKNLYMPFSGGDLPLRKLPATIAANSGWFGSPPSADSPAAFAAVLVEFSTTNNTAVFDTATHKFTTGASGFYSIAVNAGARSSGTNAPSLGFRAKIRINGVFVRDELAYTQSSFDTYISYNHEVFLSAGEEVELYMVGSTGLVFPTSNTTLNIDLLDRAGVGDTITMANTLPNITCGDFLRWVFGQFCLIVDSVPCQKVIEVYQFNSYFEPMQDLPHWLDIQLRSNHEVLPRENITEMANNNYLNYAGDGSYGNGGFSITDPRIESEKELFQSGFQATYMRSWGFLGRWLSIPAMFNEDVYPEPQKLENGYAVLYLVKPPKQEAPRILFKARVNVNVLNPIASNIDIGDENVSAVNYGYFYNYIAAVPSSISLSFKNEQQVLNGSGAVTIYGQNLTELFFSEYARDFQAYELLTVNAEMTSEQFATLSFRYLYPFKRLGYYYRLISIGQYVEGEPTELTFRRVNTFTNSSLLSVMAQVGKSGGSTQPSQAPTYSLPNDAVITQLNAIQIGFDGLASDQLTIVESTVDYPQTGDWGDITTDQLVVPESGKYQINFQVASSDDEASNAVIEIRYDILNNADELTLLFSRNAENYVHSHDRVSCNLVNEENLDFGNVIRFYATFTGGFHAPDYSQEYTFATVTQRSLTQTIPA